MLTGPRRNVVGRRRARGAGSLLFFALAGAFFCSLAIGNRAEARCNCWMCRYIRTHGHRAWAEYLRRRSDISMRSDLDLQATPYEVVAVMLDQLDLGANDVLYDLGCGDGRILIAAVERFGCRAVGIEIDPRVARIARENVRRAGCGRIRIVTGDANRYCLDEADAVTIYLFPETMTKLCPKIETTIVSYQHKIPGRGRQRRIHCQTGSIYVAAPRPINARTF